MKKILAVSGGVDSMVMLDVFCRRFPSEELVVAHFNHGVRENASEDADFVRARADEYGVRFCGGEAELGPGASEAQAREKRYEFLLQVANQYGNATIYTAHHLDDLIETVIINILRGTGWRGLAAMDRKGVHRPFLETEFFYEPMDRAAIIEYAAKRRLRFREDPSNSWDEYLRNRVRHGMNNVLSFAEKMRIYEQWQKQRTLRDEIDGIINGFLPEDGGYERKWFRGLDTEEGLQKVAREILRAGLLKAGVTATRPQIEDFRSAILNYASGKSFNLPDDRLVKLGKEEFWL